MKKTFISLITLVAITTFAKGIFLISGGDFRKSDANWKIVTTEDSQSIQITPKIHLDTSKDISKVSVKIDNLVEYNVNSDNLPSVGGVANPITFTFPKAGIHTIKMYDSDNAIIRLNFEAKTETEPNTSIKEITYPVSSYSIYDNMCKYYNGLEYVIIHEGIPSIGKEAFSYCSSLKKVVLPNSVTSIGSQAFRDCLNLEQINIPSGTTELSSYVLYYSGLTSVICPKTLTRVTGRSISMMPKLTTITFLNKDIDISSSGSNGGFEDCNQVRKIYYAGSVEDWNANTSLSSRFGTARDISNGTGTGFIDYTGSNGRNKEFYYNYKQ